MNVSNIAKVDNSIAVGAVNDPPPNKEHQTVLTENTDDEEEDEDDKVLRQAQEYDGIAPDVDSAESSNEPSPPRDDIPSNINTAAKAAPIITNEARQTIEDETMEEINSEFDRAQEEPSGSYPNKHEAGLSPVEDVI